MVFPCRGPLGKSRGNMPFLRDEGIRACLAMVDLFLPSSYWARYRSFCGEDSLWWKEGKAYPFGQYTYAERGRSPCPDADTSMSGCPAGLDRLYARYTTIPTEKLFLLRPFVGAMRRQDLDLGNRRPFTACGTAEFPVMPCHLVTGRARFAYLFKYSAVLRFAQEFPTAFPTDFSSWITCPFGDAGVSP